jgi:radical SAM superfamily enzyme YgiQ (UPF0313 family)
MSGGDTPTSAVIRPMYKGVPAPPRRSRLRFLFVIPNGTPTADVPNVRLRRTGHVAAPLGPLLIASWMGQRGIDVEIIDAEALGLDDQQTVDEVVRRAPDIVGFSLFITTVRRGAAIARAVKDRASGIKTVIGGPHVSAVPEETMQRYGDAFDVGLVGEGEKGAVLVAERIGSDAALLSVPGVVLRRDGTVFYQGGHAETVQDLDDLPFPAYHLLGDLSPYHLSEFTVGKTDKQVMIITSRGCPYGGEKGCTFCDQNVSGVYWRGMSPRRIVEAMMDVKQRGVVNIYDTDDIALVDLAREEEKAHRILETPYLRDVTWEIITRVNLVAKAASRTVSVRGRSMNLLELMYRAGLRQISIAPETGNERLRLVALQKKTVTDAMIDESVVALARAGIEIKLLCMVGVPGETPEHTLETLERIRHWGRLGATHAMISVCTPLPTTPLAQWILAGRVRWTGDLDDWDRMTLYEVAGVFTTDVHGNDVDFTPASILAASRGKHRIGSAVQPVDVKRKETIEDKIRLVSALVDDHRRSRPSAIARPRAVGESTNRS